MVSWLVNDGDRGESSSRVNICEQQEIDMVSTDSSNKTRPTCTYPDHGCICFVVQCFHSHQGGILVMNVTSQKQLTKGTRSNKMFDLPRVIDYCIRLNHWGKIKAVICCE